MHIRTLCTYNQIIISSKSKMKIICIKLLRKMLYIDA